MKRLVLVCCGILALLSSAVAQAERPPRRNPSSVQFDEDKTPLQKNIDEKRQLRLDEEKTKNPTGACAHTLNNPDLDPEIQAKNEAKFCKVPRVNKKTKVVSDLVDPRNNGKKIGRKIETETELVYDNEDPSLAENWSDLKVGRPVADEMAGVVPGEHPSNVRLRRAVLPTSAAINNDRDCLDTLSQVHFGGYREENGIKVAIPDGDPQSCFENTSPPTLRKTLVLLADGSGCQHADGTVFSPEECVAKDYTTLEELIDEDGPGANGPIDQDHDGNIEDIPDLPGEGQSACELNRGTLGPDGTCDFTKGMRRHINEKLLEKKASGELKLPPGRQDEFKQAFKWNANGDCDSTAEGEYECGKEPRTMTVNETLEMVCPRGSEYNEGRCEKPSAGVVEAASQWLGTSLLAADLVSTNSTAAQTDEAMMGFTFAPPVYKWGVNVKEDVCIFGFCFEIFAFRFGYEFDFAAGLRLPVKVTLADIPSPSVNAQETKTLRATMEPLDFSVGQYKAFCGKHNLARDWWISDCNRFAFPDYFESMIPESLLSPDNRQGSELVAQSTIFAGLIIRVVTIPVVNYAVDVDMNLPALCTFAKMKGSGLEGPLDFLTNLASAQGFLQSLRNSLTNCGTFTTPFGYEPDPVTGAPRLRSFPFLNGGYTIGADCTKALIERNTIKIGGKTKPICTGMKVDIYGASLGLAINLGLAAGSDLVDAKANFGGDARGPVNQELLFHHAATGVEEPSVGPVTFDNYTDSNTAGVVDEGIIEMDDFVYHLNQLQFRVGAGLEFGGIASFLPNIGDLTIFVLNLQLPGGGIPIPQHPGTGPVRFAVPVNNYSLSVTGKALDGTKTAMALPATPATFEITVKNEGSAPESIDNFVRSLSNRPNQTLPFSFHINLNNDFDCVAAGGQHYRGYPYDAVADDCYTAEGLVRSDRTELIDEDPIDASNTPVNLRDQDKDGMADEDPPDLWSTNPVEQVFQQQVISNVPAHSTATQRLTLQVTPYWHPLTPPGLYPVQIKADSREARSLNLAPNDPQGYARIGAQDVVFVEIRSFFDPRVRVLPEEGVVKPGSTRTYTVEGENAGNVADRIAMLRTFVDSNSGGCTLTNLGSIASCPYRATPTVIPAVPVAGWNVSALESIFGPEAGLGPLGNAQHAFTITVPADWAGMQDTVYEFNLTATSINDTAMPAASNQVVAHHKVVATKESMIRYIQLELTEFIAEIERAAALGIRARGVEPVTIHPVSMMNAKALEQTLAGDLASASKTLASEIRVMNAVDIMVNGADLGSLAGDWKARSAAILADLAAAQSCMTASGE